MVRLVFLFCLVSNVAFGANGGFCDMETALSSYKSALSRKNIGDNEVAFKMFLPLAQGAIAPAQRHVAQYYLQDSHEDMAIEKGIMWAQLAAWGGDKEAQSIVKEAVESARHAVAEAGLTFARDWRPKKPDCSAYSSKEQDDDDFKTVGRFPVIRQEAVHEDRFALFVGRLYESLVVIEDVAPYFAPLIELIPAFEVIDGDDTDRLIRWDKDNNWLKVSKGFLQDEKARQLSYSLVIAVQRYLFEEIEDAEFVDQIGSSYGRTKIYGSIYGDVRTDRFIEQFEEALKNVRNLPVVFRDKVQLVDEVHYMPPSRYHFSGLSGHKGKAFYDYKRSTPDRHMMIYTEKVGFETVEDLILELVRAGSQIQQHNLIDQYRNQSHGEKREEAILKALQGDMGEAMKMFTKTATKQNKVVDQWDKGGPESIAQFSCDATMDQVKAAIALKMDPNRLSRTLNLNPCPKAKEAVKKYQNKK